MKSVQFQVKKRLSHEVLKVTVELSSSVGVSASIAKRGSSALSTIEESGRASVSRPRAKREISELSTTVVFSQAQRMTGAKLKSTYS